jgi:KAP family P-loop domain
MRILPVAPTIDDHTGLKDEQDLFKLRSLADGMTNLVSSIDDPMVIAFDGPWGTGKSTFLRQWAGELRKKDFPVILFDAFENDYISDAFAALAREIVELVDKNSGKEVVGADFKKETIGVGKLLLKSSGKIAFKVGTKFATAGLVSDTDIKEALNSVGEEASEVYENYMEEILKAPIKQRETINSFKQKLSELSALLSPSNSDTKSLPVIFIIDELDRCRPSFALDLLEKIKHLMSVPNLHFVLGVNLDQLRESVKVEYGPNINAHIYLQKFITLTIFHGGQTNSLRGGNSVQHGTAYGNYLAGAFDVAKENQDDFKTASNFIIAIAEARGLSLREMERIYSNLTLALAFSPANYFRLAPLLGGLCALKVIEPKAFLAAKDGTLTIEIVTKALGFENFAKDVWAMNWWQAFLEVSPGDSQTKMLEQLMFKFRLDTKTIEGRRNAVAYIANEIIDKFMPQK